MRERCRKQESGSCVGCPVLDRIKNMIQYLPYQHAIDYVTNQECPRGVRPSVVTNHNKDGNLKSVAVVPTKESVIRESVVLYQKTDTL